MLTNLLVAKERLDNEFARVHTMLEQIIERHNRIGEEIEAESVPEVFDTSEQSTDPERKVTINVGGELMETSLEVLSSKPGSMLSVLFSGRQNSSKGKPPPRPI
jgi:hypothetical protein